MDLTWRSVEPVSERSADENAAESQNGEKCTECDWTEVRSGDEILNARLLASKPAATSITGKVVDKSHQGAA